MLSNVRGGTIKKILLILEKNALIVFTYGLNFSFKVLFKEYLGEKSSKL